MRETKTMTISDLIIQCNEATSKMGRNNSHKLLVLNCAAALKQMADRLFEAENRKVASE